MAAKGVYISKWSLIQIHKNYTELNIYEYYNNLNFYLNKHIFFLE